MLAKSVGKTRRSAYVLPGAIRADIASHRQRLNEIVRPPPLCDVKSFEQVVIPSSGVCTAAASPSDEVGRLRRNML